MGVRVKEAATRMTVPFPFHYRDNEARRNSKSPSPFRYRTSEDALPTLPEVLYITTSVRRSLAQAHEFDVKNQRGIRRYGPSRPLSAICHFGRNDYCPLSTDFHAGNTAVPTFDYTPRPQQK